MKIFTVTFQNNTNYGAILQAYSLSEYLNSQDNIECEVLQYFQENSNISWKLLPKPKTFRDYLRNIYLLIRIDLLYYRFKKIKVMRKYNAKLLPLSKKQYNRKVYSGESASR